MGTTTIGVKTDLDKGVQYIINENGHRVLFSDFYSFVEAYNRFNNGYDSLKQLMKEIAFSIKGVMDAIDNEEIFETVYEELKGIGEYAIGDKNAYVKHGDTPGQFICNIGDNGVDVTNLVYNAQKLAKLYQTFTMLSSYENADKREYERYMTDDYMIVGWSNKNSGKKVDDPRTDRYYSFVNIQRKNVDIPSEIFLDFLDSDESTLTGYSDFNDAEMQISIETIAIPRMVKLILNI